MIKKKSALAGMMALMPLFAQAGLTQQQVDNFAKGTELTFAVEDNFHRGDAGFIGSMQLKNNSSVTLPEGKSDWQIYVHSVRKIAKVNTKGVAVEHINGDLHRFVPTNEFAGLKVGDSLEIEFEADVWIVSYTDFMPRAFFVCAKQTPAIFTNTDTEELTAFIQPFERENQLYRYNQPRDLTKLATPELRFERNQSNAKVSKEAANKRIIPKPYSIDFNRGTAELNDNWQIRFAGRLKSEVAVFQEDLADYNLNLEAAPDHIPIGKAPTIFLKVNDGLKVDGKVVSESYHLEIDDDKVVITGSDNAGVFYGIQSFLALFPVETNNTIPLPNVEIEDTPRFAWRGMHYDNGRNYHGKDALFKMVEQMGRYKMNKFHWHFSEDEGWRLEIPGLPELTEIGGYRCFDLDERKCLLTQLGTGPFKSGSGNGYLSRKDFVELLKFAKARHIDIIPEIEGPGHARASIKAMEARYDRLMAEGNAEQAKAYLLSDPLDASKYITVQNYTDNSMNACMDSTYTFIEKVT